MVSYIAFYHNHVYIFKLINYRMARNIVMELTLAVGKLTMRCQIFVLPNFCSAKFCYLYLNFIEAVTELLCYQ